MKLEGKSILLGKRFGDLRCPKRAEDRQMSRARRGAEKVVLGYVGAEEGNCSPRERTCRGLPPGSRAGSPRKLHPLFCPCTLRALTHTHTHTHTHTPNSPKRKEKESESEVAQFSLSDSVTPWTAAYHASPSMGFSRPEFWSGLPFPSPEDLPDPGRIEPKSPTLQADTLPSEPPGKSSLRKGKFLLKKYPK